MQTIEQALKRSKFRASFKLTNKDVLYIEKIGLDKIQSHAQDFIVKRISKAFAAKDGKQTPMRGHPVFVAQHATATCCRGCIAKWHKIPVSRRLSQEEIVYFKKLIMNWISKELKKIIDRKKNA